MAANGMGAREIDRHGRPRRKLALWCVLGGLLLLAVQRFRLACGRLPDALDPLVPDYLAAIPPDPFDGAPLRYQGLERGFMVYSVGEDGQDDGGKSEPQRGKKKQGESFDLVFRVER